MSYKMMMKIGEKKGTISCHAMSCYDVTMLSYTLHCPTPCNILHYPARPHTNPHFPALPYTTMHGRTRP